MKLTPPGEWRWPSGPPGARAGNGKLAAAEALLEDTVLLAEAHTDADLSSFHQDLAERRRPADPPRLSRGLMLGQDEMEIAGLGGHDDLAADGEGGHR